MGVFRSGSAIEDEAGGSDGSDFVPKGEPTGMKKTISNFGRKTFGRNPDRDDEMRDLRKEMAELRERVGKRNNNPRSRSSGGGSAGERFSTRLENVILRQRIKELEGHIRSLHAEPEPPCCCPCFFKRPTRTPMATTDAMSIIEMAEIP